MSDTALCGKCGKEVPGLSFCDQCGQPLAGGDGTVVGGTVLQPGTLIAGKYELGRRLAGGGMGILYEGKNKKLDRKVAIKKMRDELKLDQKLRKKFIQEARTVAQLHHPHIVEILDVLAGKEDGLADPDETYLVFAFVEGRSLKEALEAGPLPLAKARKLGLQICSALKYAHGQKVTHRDLKPANIMVGADDFAVVLDFGIARTAKDTLLSVTNTQDTSGTLSYMAPEQHLGRADHRADIFSFGATLYEMLTSEPAFPGPDHLAQKKEMSFEPASKKVAGLADGMDAFLARCLQTDPGKRFHSADEAAAALEKI